MANPFSALIGILPSKSHTEGTVTSVADDGIVTVTTLSGGTMRCTSLVTVQAGQQVEIAGQQIISAFEPITTYEITI